MKRKVSTTARNERVSALARRYAVSTRAEKTWILDEFEAVTGFHRKHGMRVLRSGATVRRAEGRTGRRIYDEAVRDALVVLPGRLAPVLLNRHFRLEPNQRRLHLFKAVLHHPRNRWIDHLTYIHHASCSS